MKKIIHIDMDSFFASVEMRDNPDLKGKSIAIGWKVEHRWVLSTCNYEARKFGLKSAMSTAKALKLCPQVILIEPRFEVYKAVSSEIGKIFAQYTDKIEFLSLDEAYLDVTNCELFSGSATWIAEDIRKKIFQKLNLTASAGIAPLKFLAKIASDMNKPNWQFVILPENMNDFIKKLLVGKIPWVWKVTEQKLKNLKIFTCWDILKKDEIFLQENFWKFWRNLWEYANGIDDREVKDRWPSKSIGVETTFYKDIFLYEELVKNFEKLFWELLVRIEKRWKKLSDFKKIWLKLKFADFTQTTISKTKNDIEKEDFFPILEQIWERRKGKKVRLLGLNVEFWDEKFTMQMILF